MTLPRILLTGAAGMLARAFIERLDAGDADYVALSRNDLDVTDAAAVRNAILDFNPGIVIQCAGYTRVDEAESQPARAFAVNADGAANVAAACREVGARFLYPSTDYVFDGSATSPYPPEAAASPLNAYGRSKMEGEKLAAAAGGVLIIRTSWLYGAGGRNFVRTVADRVTTGQTMRVVADQHGAPTWTADFATAALQLLRSPAATGTFHFTNSGAATWYDLAVEVARELGAAGRVEPCGTADFPVAARRPRYSVLDCSSTEALIGKARPWRVALREALSKQSF